jgi:penicillin-binding protein 1A
MKVALAGRPASKFIPPNGLIFHRVDRKSGQEVADGAGISEAFKPGTAPCRGACAVIGDEEQLNIASDPGGLDDTTRAELLRNTGGLY